VRLSLLRRHWFATFPDSIFSGCPIALISPFLKIGLSRFARNTRHARSNCSRASSNIADVPLVISPGPEPGRRLFRSQLFTFRPETGQQLPIKACSAVGSSLGMGAG
jgi:hypothetical protein